ncbi:DUF1631 domain-containing protein [Acidihalobacter prosperus]|uniref:DUF1631 domain-containing protein n=1 Tax=Acidihalobacter prosperus TaxID=160660 RepID=UPI0005046E45|nr:DUF1631 domain-containing protein [Acidihalobacter prosperus]
MSQSRSENVVSLDPQRNRLGAVERSQLAARIREQIRKGLTQRLHVMLEQVDDALFARADRAESNQQQATFFDAMREIRLKRPTLEADFAALILKRFDQALNDRRPPPPQAQRNAQDAELSLIETDELEERLAVDAMVTKARRLYAEALYLIGQRLAAMAGTSAPAVDEVAAIGPDVICGAFQEAASALEIDIHTRLLLYKLFDQDVINTLGDFYAGINVILRENGILPTLSSADAGHGQARRPRNARGGAAPNAEVGSGEAIDQGAEREDEIAQALRNFLYGNGVRATASYPAAGPAGGGQGGVGYAPRLPVVEALSRLQVAPAVGQYFVDGGLSLNTEALKRGLIESGTAAGMATVIRPMEDKTIDVVAMLFDFLFEDPDLPGEIKGAVARLQIPVLKAALIDAEFFTRRQHPVRRLLNQMARAAVGWSPEADDPDDGLLPCIQRLVDRVIDEFEDNVQVFSDVLETFEDWLQQSEHRSSVREEEAVGEARQAESRAVAKAAAATAIDETIGEAILPEPAAAFLKGPWSNLLAGIYRLEGAGSPTWDRVLNVASTLVWSLMPKESEAARRQLLETLPALLRALRDGMERLRLPPAGRERLLNCLAVEHTRLARAHRPTPTTPPEVSSETQGVATEAKEDHPTDAHQEELPDAQSFMARKAAQINRMIDEGRFLGSVMPRLTEEGPLDHFYDRAESMGEGTWLDWTDREGRELRIKLSWKSVISGKYFFVNRQGVKVAEMNTHGLAHEIREGRARVIEDASMVDRALLSVLGNLQQGM